MKPKCLDFPGLKILGSEAVLLHHWAHGASALETLLLLLCNLKRAGYLRFQALLAKTGMKQFNLAALLN